MAIVVGATQKQIEDEYYMLDLVKVAEKTRKKQGAKKLELLNIVNSDRLEKNDYQTLVDRFINEAGLAQMQEKFSRNKFEELRELTNKMRG